MTSRIVFLLLLTAFLPLSADGADGEDPFAVTGPFDAIINFLTGPFGRAAGTLALIVVGFLWWRAREEEGSKFQNLINWALGIAIVLNAPTIVETLGFAGATF